MAGPRNGPTRNVVPLTIMSYLFKHGEHAVLAYQILIIRGQSVSRPSQPLCHADSLLIGKRTFWFVHVVDDRQADDLWHGSKETLQSPKDSKGGPAIGESRS